MPYVDELKEKLDSASTRWEWDSSIQVREDVDVTGLIRFHDCPIEPEI